LPGVRGLRAGLELDEVHALAVAKAATISAMDLGGGTLSPADRAEVLAIAVRTLKGLSLAKRCRSSQRGVRDDR
jgi:hypothetical protein